MILAAAMNPEAMSGVGDSIARLRRGDPDALSAAISLYQHRLFRYLVRLVQDAAAADDLFQQTWLLVIEKIGRYDARRSFEPWLFSIARHLAIDFLRRRTGESLDASADSGLAPESRFAALQPDPLEQLLDFERASTLAACLAELPPIHREVLSLRFEEGMKLEEIADLCGLPLPTVKSRLQRALEGLRGRVQARFTERRRT
jgi:RNA polymerase sigma-70 factor (ECF subfamily)